MSEFYQVGYIQIKRAQIHDAEVIERVIKGVEFKILERLHNFLGYGTKAVKNVMIDLFQLVHRNRIGLGIKVAQVAQQEAEGVADFPVGLSEAL